MTNISNTRLSDTAVKLLDMYELFPFQHHPLWKAIINKELSKEEVLRAEGQHYLRTKAGQPLRKLNMERSAAVSSILYDAIIETYKEECTDEDGSPTHLDLIARMLLENGYSTEYLSKLQNTPGNIAAISMYEYISNRGVGCHIIGAGIVEHFYSQLSPTIYKSYTENYNFSESSVETYKLHGPMDAIHASRAMEAIDEAVNIHGLNAIEDSVREAFVATSLHYDGMLQAATGVNNYWNGKK